MNVKILNFCLVITSFLGYLEWGKDQSTFLIEAEYEIFTPLFVDPLSVMHPFILIPMAGQLVLIFTLFQKKPSRILTFLGMACIAILLLFMLIIGILGPNFKVLASTLPFLITGILVMRERKSYG